MADPFVRPDVRQFLDLSRQSARPEEPRGRAGGRAADDGRLAPRVRARRRATLRVDARHRRARSTAAALRCASGARAGAVLRVHPRRRLGARRSRDARAVLHRSCASSSTCRWSRSTIGWRPSIPSRPRSRIRSPRRAGSRAGRRSLGATATGLFLPATARAAISRPSSRRRCATSRQRSGRRASG